MGKKNIHFEARENISNDEWILVTDNDSGEPITGFTFEECLESLCRFAMCNSDSFDIEGYHIVQVTEEIVEPTKKQFEKACENVMKDL